MSFWVRVDRAGTSGPLFARSGGVMNGNRGYDIDLQADGYLAAGLHHVDPDNAVQIATTGAVLKPGTWHHLTLTWDGSSRAAGIGLFVDGVRPATRVVIDHLRRSIVHDGSKKNWGGGETPMRFGRRGDERLDGVSIDELRVFDRQLSRLEVQALAGVADPLGAILRTPAAARSAAQQAALREHYALRVDPAAAATRRALTGVRGDENTLLTSRVEVMAMRDRAAPRKTFVLARGAYDAPTEEVAAGTPQAIGSLPEDAAGQPPRPRALAHGARTSADGAGDRQPHLGAAVRARPGRDAGRLRQPGPAADPPGAARLAGNAVRRVGLGSQGAAEAAGAVGDLPAVVDRRRCGARARSGERVAVARARVSAVGRTGARRRPRRQRPAGRQIGGPSVYPYQPAGLWEALATRNATTYEVGKGDDLYRRSLYTVWKRSSPPPSTISFDAAERLFCTVSRQRTSTPLQALVLLNDPQFVEASRALAARMIREAGGDVGGRIALGFRALTGRVPTSEERAALESLYRDELARFRRERGAAATLLAVGASKPAPEIDAAELAAATVVASTVMNLDDAVTKR